MKRVRFLLLLLGLSNNLFGLQPGNILGMKEPFLYNLKLGPYCPVSLRAVYARATILFSRRFLFLAGTGKE